MQRENSSTFFISRKIVDIQMRSYCDAGAKSANMQFLAPEQTIHIFKNSKKSMSDLYVLP